MVYPSKWTSLLVNHHDLAIYLQLTINMPTNQLNKGWFTRTRTIFRFIDLTMRIKTKINQILKWLHVKKLSKSMIKKNKSMNRPQESNKMPLQEPLIKLPKLKEQLPPSMFNLQINYWSPNQKNITTNDPIVPAATLVTMTSISARCVWPMTSMLWIFRVGIGVFAKSVRMDLKKRFVQFVGRGFRRFLKRMMREEGLVFWDQRRMMLGSKKLGSWRI